MGGSEKVRLVPWRRHYGEPKGLSGKSSYNRLVPGAKWMINTEYGARRTDDAKQIICYSTIGAICISAVAR